MKNTYKKNTQPKIFFDKKEDIIWVVFKDGKEGRYEELTPNIKLEYDDEGNLIGLELLNASRQQTFVNTIISDRNVINNYENITDDLTLVGVNDIKITSNRYFQSL